MTTFIADITRDLLDRGYDLRRLSLVVPGRRAGVFFRREIARQYPHSTFVPRILTIEELAVQLAGMEKADDIPLLFEFYRAYLDCVGAEEREAFDVAARWGRTLLNDFDEIDRYLLAPADVFATLQDVEHIENWDPSAPLSPMMERHKNFWHLGEKLYYALRERLEKEGKGYGGMILRRAAEQIETRAQRLPQDTHWVFAGFNALSSSEQRIVKYFVRQLEASIYYDADRYFMDNPRHSAGVFLRRLRDDAVLGQGFRWIGDRLRSDKRLELIEVPRDVSQAKVAAQELRSALGQDGEALEDTALVLADENLLVPMLSSLPEQIPSINVTMGYPLSALPSAGLADALLDLYSAGEKLNIAGYYHKDVTALLRHNLCAVWLTDQGTDYAARLARRIIRQDRVDVSAEDLTRDLPEGIRARVERVFADKPQTPKAVCGRVLEVVDALRSESDPLDDLTREYLFKLSGVFTRLADYMERYPYIENLTTLRGFYRQIAAGEKLDFFGQPLEGLQLMGLLETRLLDFRRLIIAGANEGVLPGGKNDSSFIPYDVKRHFALPTYSERDAVYAYHFFRLLSRAEHITVLYNTQQGDLGQVEPSRFLQQIQHDFARLWHIRCRALSFGSPALPERTVSRPKTPFALRSIRSILTEGLSPSALNMYLCNPMEFYYRKVLAVGEPEAVEESAAANTMGSIVHQVLAELYGGSLGTPLTAAALEAMVGRSDEAVRRAFAECLGGKDFAHGRNYLVFRAVKRMVDNVLRAEKEQVESGARIIVRELETSLECTLDGVEDGLKVKLRGQADRIDTFDGRLRIVDYKTGRAEAAELRLESMEQLRPSRLSPDGKADVFAKPKALQVLMYAYLYHRTRGIGNDGFQAGILSLRQPSAGLIGLNFTTEKARAYRYDLCGDDLRDFEDALRRILSGLLDPGMPFEEAGDVYYDIG